MRNGKSIFMKNGKFKTQYEVPLKIKVTGTYSLEPDGDKKLILKVNTTLVKVSL